MRKFFDSFLWAFLAIFSIPTFLIMASWNSLPGDPLYRVKLALEDMLIFVAPTYAAKGNLQIKYTERRYVEASRLLSEKQSTQGLQYLNSQVFETKETILKARDQRSREQLAYAYIDSLTTMQAELELKRQGYGGTNPTYVKTQAKSAKKRPPQKTPVPARTLTPTPISQPEQISDKISQTQQEIQDAIDELEDEVENLPRANQMQAQDGGSETNSTPSATPTHGATFLNMSLESAMEVATSPSPSPTPAAETPTPTAEPTTAPQATNTPTPEPDH